MSDPEMPFVSLEAIESHIVCLRQRHYRHDLEAVTAPRHRSFDNRRKMLRKAIFEGFDEDSEEQQAVINTATSLIDTEWANYTDKSYFISSSQERYDKAVAKQVVTNYFETVGMDHLDRIEMKNTENLYFVDDTGVTCSIDLVVEASADADENYHIYQFLPNLKGGVPFGYDDLLSDYRNGEAYVARKVAHVIRTCVMIEALSHLDGPVGMSYLGLGDTVSPVGDASDPHAVEVELRERNLTDQHVDNGRQYERLLEELVESITAGETEVQSHRRDTVFKRECKSCEFKPMCTEKINSEVAFK